MDRRDFLKSAALTSAAALAPAATPALVQFPAKPKTFVGIQMDIGRILTVLSRSYSEMRPENLRGAGIALESLGLV